MLEGWMRERKVRRVVKLALIGVAILLIAFTAAQLPVVYTVLAAFFAILAGSFWILRRTNIDETEKWGSFLQSVATILAIGAAVYLYHVERRSQPHADVSQTVQIAALREGDGVTIEAYIIVKNLGTQLLKLDHIYSRLEAIDVRVLNSDGFLGFQHEAYQNAVGSSDGQRLFEGTELRWKQLRFFDRDIHHEIEPGESDLITATFVLPCPVIRHVRVATDLSKPPAEQQFAFGSLFGSNSRGQNENSDRHKELHSLLWKTRTMVDLEPACGKI